MARVDFARYPACGGFAGYRAAGGIFCRGGQGVFLPGEGEKDIPTILFYRKTGKKTSSEWVIF